MKTTHLVSVLVAASLAGACVGNITSPGSEDPAEPETPVETTQAVCSGKLCVQPSHLSRLTRGQYQNSVHQLLGDAVNVDLAYLPQDQLTASAFKTTEAEPVSDKDVEAYSNVAEAAAASADLEALLPCAVANGDATCAKSFVIELLPRAYRRTVTDEEIGMYLDLFETLRSEGDDFETAMRTLIATALQSPSYLYRLEQGGTSGPRALDGRELANRLAYFLWREAPDAELLAAAENGELGARDGVEKWARALLEDPRFDRALAEFHRDWLGVGDVAGTPRDPELFPDFSPELASSMLEETERFAIEVFRNDDARQETLLGTSWSMIDAPLAGLYGVTAPASGFARTNLPGRAGVLTQGSVLTTFSTGGYTTPIFRGIFVRKRILCQELKPRPENVDEIIAGLENELTGDLTDREHLQALTGSGECVQCHTLTNQVGYAFDGFDGIGKKRTHDYSGAPVDTASSLDGAGSPDYQTDADGAYSSAKELVPALAASSNVAECLSLSWLRYALGYDAQHDITSLDAAFTDYRASNHDLRELVVAVAGSDAFRHRVVPAPKK